MARGRRYYSEEDPERGITPSQLKRASAERQKQYMRSWFHSNFEDPANETPYNGREGGYQYIWGGPYDATEELEAEFGSLVPFERIEEIADDIQGEDGILDWAPSGNHPDLRNREEDFRREQEEQDEPAEQDTLPQIIERLQAGVKPSYGDAFEVAQRRALLEKLDQFRSALQQITPSHGGLGHNNPPPDEDGLPDLQEIREVTQTIQQEVAKPEPDALQVATSTSRLKKLADLLVAGAGLIGIGILKRAGEKIADAVLTKPVLDSLHQIAADVVHQAVIWLSHVTIPF